MSSILKPEHEAILRDQLTHLLHDFANALEVWTVVCLTQGDLGDPELYIDTQWHGLVDRIHAIRTLLLDHGVDPPPLVQEQLAKLTKTCADLREVFEVFLSYRIATQNAIERGILRLEQLWQDVRLRITLFCVLLPLSSPAPSISSEQEAYYQGILDSLFDRFVSARSA